MDHCCQNIAATLTERESSLVYIPKFREYGLRVLDGGSSYILVVFCPWCGARLPASLRYAWFDALEAMGLERGSADLPAAYLDDSWWKGRDL